MAVKNGNASKDNGVIWEDPPSLKVGVWERRLLPLVENPGRWARVVEAKSEGSSSGILWHLRNRKLQLPKGADFEFLREGKRIYARCVSVHEGK